MPKCALCDKGSQKSASRSHSMIKTIKRQKPNLQKQNGKLICTRCLRAQVKQGKKNK